MDGCYLPEEEFVERQSASGFVARTTGHAVFLVRRLIIRANDGLRAVAPEMIRRDMIIQFLGERFLGGKAGEHFFRAEMFAKILAHASPFNLSNVRRISAWAMGTL
jgi:hypothetical protein